MVRYGLCYAILRTIQKGEGGVSEAYWTILFVWVTFGLFCIRELLREDV